jgi:ADP-ribose pyrophosphatase YjhB (NUDIX family)
MKIDLTTNGFLFKSNKVLLIYHKKYQMWIGVGGHIDKNETPDSQLLREMKEELAIDVEILSRNLDAKITDNVIRVCPIPFHADLHNVGDHNHYAQYYVCVQKDSNQEIKPERSEIKQYDWFTEKEVENDPRVEEKTKIIVLKAFKTYRELI